MIPLLGNSQEAFINSTCSFEINSNHVMQTAAAAATADGSHSQTFWETIKHNFNYSRVKST